MLFSAYYSEQYRGKYMWKFPYMEVIRGKWNKVETRLFTSCQGYSNKLRKHKMLIVAS